MSTVSPAPATKTPSAERWKPGRKTTIVAVIVLIVLSLSYVVNAADRQVFPVLGAAIAKQYGFPLAANGLLASIFTLGVGIGGLPAGRLLDRLSRKTTMLVGILIYSVFTLLTPLAFGLADMAIYRTATGIGEALQNTALFSAMGAYFYQRRSLAIGAVSIAYGVGGSLGPIVGAQLFAHTGSWQLPFYSFGLLGAVFVLVILLFVNKHFTEAKDTQRDVNIVKLENETLPDTLMNRTSVFLLLACGAAGLSLYSFVSLYPTFLQTQLHFSVGDAGLAASLFGIGSLVMCIPAGLLGDRFGNRFVMQVAFGLAFLAAVAMFTIATTPVEQFILSAIVGAMGSGIIYVNLYAAVQRSLRARRVGRASGAFVTYFYGPSAVAGYLFGQLVTWFGWGWAAALQMGFFAILGIVFVGLARLPRVQDERRSVTVPEGAE